MKNSSMHYYFRLEGRSPSILVVFRWLRSPSWTKIRLLKRNEVYDLAQLSQIRITVLDGGMLHRRVVLVFHKLCKERRSFQVVQDLQADEFSLFPVQKVSVYKPSLYSRSGVTWRFEIAWGRQEDGQQNITLQCGPTVETRGLWVEDSLERQFLYNNEYNSVSGLQSVTMQWSSLRD